MPSRPPLPLAAFVCLAPALGVGAQAAPGQDAVRAPSRRVEGRVLDADGWPLPGARVFVLPGPGAATATDARRPLLETASDRDGHFVLQDLRPGTYRVDIEAPDHQAAHVGVHLPEGGGHPAPLEVHLWPVTTAARPARRRTDATASERASTLASSPATTPEPAAGRSVSSGVVSPASPPAPAAASSARSPETSYSPSTEPPSSRASPRGVSAEPAAADSATSDAAADDGLAEAVDRALAASQVPHALALLESVPEKRAADADLFFRVGDALLRSGETGEAVRVLGEALERDPDHLGARYARALARLGTGELDGAREDFQRVLQLQPDGPFAEKAHAALDELGASAQ
jgi:hypothetical protein